MEGNKDEAQRCRELAIEAYKKGNLKRALHLLQRSERMYSCEDNQVLIEKYSKEESAAPAQSSSQGASTHATNGTGNSTCSPQNSSRQANASTNRSRATHSETAYTAEQDALCKRVLKTRDYYKILNVERDASDEVIKKAYKKLALQLHPDKNGAPDAEEAFKKVSKVFQCLQDPEKRQIYDVNGDEEKIPRNMRTRFESDFMSPEDLFNAFFGGDLVRRGAPVRIIRAEQHGQSSPHSLLSMLIQMIPVVLFIFVPLLSSIFQLSERQPFSLQKRNGFSKQMKTTARQISFFVPENFDSQFPVNSILRKDLERKVELKYYELACEAEQNDYFKQMAYYNYRNAWKEAKKLRSQRQVNCDTYRYLMNIA